MSKKQQIKTEETTKVLLNDFKKQKQKDLRLRKIYGTTLEEFAELSKDGCMICFRKDGRICQDHIHVKGFKLMSPEEKRKYLRGALCFMCNTALKGFEKTNNGHRNRQQLEGTYNYFTNFALKGEIE